VLRIKADETRQQNTRAIFILFISVMICKALLGEAKGQKEAKRTKRNLFAILRLFALLLP
jgi:hypothetical protein